jgi:hypothetical protein
MSKRAANPLTHAQLLTCLGGLSEANTAKALQMYKEAGLIKDFKIKDKDNYGVELFHQVRHIVVRLRLEEDDDDAP